MQTKARLGFVFLLIVSSGGGECNHDGNVLLSHINSADRRIVGMRRNSCVRNSLVHDDGTSFRDIYHV